MTADVNFTALARAGPACRPPAGALRARSATWSATPCRPLLRAATDGDEGIAEFLGNPVFKVLVLGTRTTDAFTGPLISPLPLFRNKTPRR